MANDPLRDRDGRFQASAHREASFAQRAKGERRRSGWVMPSGQVVMGPSFYVWDESPKQAREWGVELANAWLTQRR